MSDETLLGWLASCNKDPVAFVMGAFPWAEAGPLSEFEGPDPWQLDILNAIKDGLMNINEAIQLATASGHGIGKSALVAWIILWGFTTAPDTRGVVTANTEAQLKTKTWSELGKWFNLFIAREHFTLTATSLLSKDPTRERTWRLDMIPWSEKNTEAFAGLHNKGKRILLIMDEASAIPDVIWETAEGALTDSETEIIWAVFGNPTRNAGRFKECFAGGLHAKFWNHRQIDSRTVAITNKKRLQAWIETYGDDSDFVRIRVLGQFPRQGLMEFFSSADWDEATTREVTTSITDPLALGVDVARFGANNSCIFARKGRDARTIPSKLYNGLDTVGLATAVFASNTELQADGLMIDGGGVGGGVVDNLRNMHLHVYEVQFGGKDDTGGATWGTQGERYANKRAAMYGALRYWLKGGALPPSSELKKAAMAIKYTFNKKDEILLESKEDIMADNPDISLDELDALVLTFAYPLAPHRGAGGIHAQFQQPYADHEYNPYDEKRMIA